jgi:hypothetical protein
MVAAGVAFIRMPYAMERLILRGVINDTFETSIPYFTIHALGEPGKLGPHKSAALDAVIAG